MKNRKDSFGKNEISLNDQTATFCQTYVDGDEERTYDCMMEPSLALTGPVKSNYSQIPDTLKKLIH